MDSLTAQLIHQIEQLPARKKAAILELLKTVSPVAMARSNEELAAWKASLLDVSVWTEEDLQRITDARAWINRWTPTFS